MGHLGVRLSSVPVHAVVEVAHRGRDGEQEKTTRGGGGGGGDFDQEHTYTLQTICEVVV